MLTLKWYEKGPVFQDTFCVRVFFFFFFFFFAYHLFQGLQRVEVKP